MKYIEIFLISYFIMVLIMPYVIKLFTRWGIIDLPNNRKVHDKPIPRMGGLILFVIIISFLIYFTSELNNIWLIILSSFFLAICGIIDDIKGLKWLYKLIFQSIAVVITIIYLFPKFEIINFIGILFPPTLGFILLFFFFVGTINAFNMMDGMDGLITGFSLLVLFAIMFIAFEIKNNISLIIIAITLGGTAGFLKFNLLPAKIFLGDTGSLILGYFITFVSLLLSINSGTHILNLNFAVILLGVPIIDTVKVMIVRIINKKNPFYPDKAHLHHILFGNKICYRTTVFVIHIFTFLFIVIALIYLKYSEILGTILFIFLSLVLIAIKRILIILREYEFINNKLFINSRLYQFILGFNKKIYLLISLIILLSMLFIFYPYNLYLKSDLKNLITVTIGLLFLISVFRIKDSPIYRDFYFFLNITIFMILTCYSDSLFTHYNYLSNLKLNVFISVIIFMLFILMIMILLSTKNFNISKKRINNKDLIIFLMIILLVLIGEIFNLNLPPFLTVKLSFAFIFYLWYRILVIYNEKYKDIIYLISFILPLSVLIINH